MGGLDNAFLTCTPRSYGQMLSRRGKEALRSRRQLVLLCRLGGAHLGGDVRLEILQRRDFRLFLGLALLSLARLLLPSEPCVLRGGDRRGTFLRVRRAHHPFPPAAGARETRERDVGLAEHVVAEGVLDGARRGEVRDGIRDRGRLRRGRIGGRG